MGVEVVERGVLVDLLGVVAELYAGVLLVNALYGRGKCLEVVNALASKVRDRETKELLRELREACKTDVKHCIREWLKRLGVEVGSDD